ncbi:unnamed protein product [Chrysoparadoxa australica]
MPNAASLLTLLLAPVNAVAHKILAILPARSSPSLSLSQAVRAFIAPEFTAVGNGSMLARALRNAACLQTCSCHSVAARSASRRHLTFSEEGGAIDTYLTEGGSRGSGSMGDVIGEGDRVSLKLNQLINKMMSTTVDEWTPELLEDHREELKQGSRFKQAMQARVERATDPKERDSLNRVHAFLTGFVRQEKRKINREKVSFILNAVARSAEALDEAIGKLSENDEIDQDLTDHIEGLIEEEERKHGGDPTLLFRVLHIVDDRLKAEMQTSSRPEIKVLAYALLIKDPEEIKVILTTILRLTLAVLWLALCFFADSNQTSCSGFSKPFTILLFLPPSTYLQLYLMTSIKSLEELNTFCDFVESGLEYLGGAGIAVKSNMPLDNIDR